MEVGLGREEHVVDDDVGAVGEELIDRRTHRRLVGDARGEGELRARSDRVDELGHAAALVILTGNRRREVVHDDRLEVAARVAIERHVPVGIGRISSAAAAASAAIEPEPACGA